jgi:acetylornithine deacetylase/succinyl-diaminopimelate desuccinylase-like protein
MAKVATGQRAEDMKAILKTPPDPAAVERLSKDPIDHSKMRTTCVATRLDAGHANNALPQMAKANVNCRIAPGHSAEDIRLKLIEILADTKITVKYVGTTGEVTERGTSRKSYAPPPLRPDVFQPLERVVAEMWPGIPVVPTMSTGASDGVYTNAASLPTYGISGTAIDRDDQRSHGKDERMGIESYYKGADFYYRYLKAVTGEAGGR